MHVVLVGYALVSNVNRFFRLVQKLMKYPTTIL